MVIFTDTDAEQYSQRPQIVLWDKNAFTEPKDLVDKWCDEWILSFTCEDCSWWRFCGCQVEKCRLTLTIHRWRTNKVIDFKKKWYQNIRSKNTSIQVYKPISWNDWENGCKSDVINENEASRSVRADTKSLSIYTKLKMWWRHYYVVYNTVRFWDMIRYHRDVTCFFPGLVLLDFRLKMSPNQFFIFCSHFCYMFLYKIKDR